MVQNVIALSSALLIPEHRTGLYYGSIGQSVVDAAITANRLYAAPVVIPATKTYDRIGINVAGTAVGNARLGIYSDSAGYPGALVLDAGTLSVNASPSTPITITQSLVGPAKYWLALVSDVAPTLQRIGGIGFFNGSGVTVALYSGVYRAFTYAALPDPWGTPTAFESVPYIALRAA